MVADVYEPAQVWRRVLDYLPTLLVSFLKCFFSVSLSPFTSDVFPLCQAGVFQGSETMYSDYECSKEFIIVTHTGTIEYQGNSTSFPVCH
jgi:hypothetical protein